jgi:2-polyprenyl-6-methoxyphenol hydroxylase-like FAD-dependent oxidoreductase
MDHDVLIVGAGPTGLVLALWLTQQGAKVRILDKTAEPGTTSRAMAVQARTLEFYRQLGLADRVLERSVEARGLNLWVRGKCVARVPFEKVGSDLTAFGFIHIFPQDEHERLLVAKLAEAGVCVERKTELVSFTDGADRVVARLKRADGQEEECVARFIAGCDGASSLVRKLTGIGFPGGTYQRIFYVADVEAAGEAVNGELNVDLDQADFVAIFPMEGEGRVRLIGTVKSEHTAHADTVTFDDVSHRAIDGLKLEVRKVNWFSTYRVHHRVAEHFRRGRAFILGDAAHIHSPAGGQGMNTGIGDAVNLAWKLAEVVTGRAPESLLDSFEAERIPFARRLVATTDRAFSFVSADGALADVLRTRLAPLLLPHVLDLKSAQDFAFRTVSQIALNYRNTPLSRGIAGRVHGGDRLPWVPVAGIDNHTSLSALTWQVHVYGTPNAELKPWCMSHGIALHVFEWSREYEEAGFARDAVYLVRPDGYVAMADPTGSSSSLEQYSDEMQLNFLQRSITS